MEEVSFFQNNTVIVTQSRFIVESKVYEIKEISSVKVGVSKNYTRTKIIIMIIGFLLMFFKDGRIAGVAIFVISFFLLYLSQDKFVVRIKTGNNETDGLRSKDKEYIEQVVKAINMAMESQYLKAFPM
jgi:hypothetical protein